MTTDLNLVATALNTYLSEKYNTTVVTDDSWAVTVGKILVDAVTVPFPWIKSVIDVLDTQHSSRSVTLPKLGGEGAIIIYSTAAISNPLSYCVTIVHEHEHARELVAKPDATVMANYLLSTEMRSVSEARAYACGAFVRYLLTGNLQSGDEIVDPLAHGYLLSRSDIETGRSIVMSDLATMARGAVPPHSICREVLGLLQREFPNAIVPKAFRVAGT